MKLSAKYTRPYFRLQVAVVDGKLQVSHPLTDGVYADVVAFINGLGVEFNPTHNTFNILGKTYGSSHYVNQNKIDAPASDDWGFAAPKTEEVHCRITNIRNGDLPFGCIRDVDVCLTSIAIGASASGKTMWVSFEPDREKYPEWSEIRTSRANARKGGARTTAAEIPDVDIK